MKNSNKNNNATLQATLTTEQLLKLKDTEVKQLGGLEEQTTTKKQLQLNPVKTYSWIYYKNERFWIKWWG